MSKKDTKNEIPVCSFCGKSRDQVNRLIAGPEGAYICDGCVEICAGIVEDELYHTEEETKTSEDINLLKPKEIKEFLDDYVIGQDEAIEEISKAFIKYILKNREYYKEIIVTNRRGIKTSRLGWSKDPLKADGD